MILNVVFFIIITGPMRNIVKLVFNIYDIKKGKHRIK